MESSEPPYDAESAYLPGVITPTQPKVPEAKVRGSQVDFQSVLVILKRVPGVQKGVAKGSCRGTPDTP
jgi:hypothetical protein